MSLPRDDAEILSAQWIEGVLLKRDVFSAVERGRFRTPDGEVDAVLRRIDQVPWWSYVIARHLFSRERHALAVVRDLNVGPELLWAGKQALVRGFIDGVAMHLAKPAGNAAYFRSAKQTLRRLHRAGICHNDLAKEQNWLIGKDGRAYVTDFQLAACFRKRGRLFRIGAYEDLRHLLKLKRSYVPSALTPQERKILARKSIFASVWLATGKKVYRAITRGLHEPIPVRTSPDFRHVIVPGAADQKQLALAPRGGVDLLPHAHRDHEILIAVRDPDGDAR